MQYTVAVTWGVCLTHSGQAQKFSAVSAGRDEVMAVLCLVTYILKYYIFAFMLFFFKLLKIYLTIQMQNM